MLTRDDGAARVSGTGARRRPAAGLRLVGPGSVAPCQLTPSAAGGGCSSRRSSPSSLLGGLGWYWFTSLVPSTYSVMDMGQVDYGGGPRARARRRGRRQRRRPDRAGRRAAGRRGRPGGPRGVVRPGQRRARSRATRSTARRPGPRSWPTRATWSQVTLTNVDVPDGVDAALARASTCRTPRTASPGSPRTRSQPGSTYVYRFVAEHAGTYWYHSHQVSHAQVRGGLFGALVVLPADPARRRQDVVAPVHTYGGRRTVNGEHRGHLRGRRRRRPGPRARDQHRQRTAARPG